MSSSSYPPSFEQSFHSPSGHYSHSGKVAVGGLVVWTLLALLGATVVAVAYAYAIFYIPYVILNVLLACGFGFALYWLLLHSMRKAKLRNKGVFVAVVVAVTAWAYYAHWATWVFVLLQQGGVTGLTPIDVALQPAELWNVVVAINGEGAWTLFGNDVRGVPLTIVWVLEAAVVFGLALVLALGDFDDLPFCERCDRWAEKEDDVLRVWHGDEATVLAAFQERPDRLADLVTVPKENVVGGWYQADFKTCPQCRSITMLDVSRVTAEENKKGEVTKKSEKVVANRMLGESVVQAIRAHAARPPAPAEPQAP